MNLISLLQLSLANIWFVIALSLIILGLGWLAGRIISFLLLKSLNRIPLYRTLVAWLGLPDSEQLHLRLQRISRWLVFVLALWGSWKTLQGHPLIANFSLEAWKLVIEFARLPAVIFTLDLALALIITYILRKALGWTKKGFFQLAQRIAAERGKRLRGVVIQKLQLLSADQVTNILLVINRYLRYAVNLILLLFYLTGLFSIFPQTRGVVNTLLTSIFQIFARGWMNFVSFLPNLVNLLIIILVTNYGLKLLHFIFREIGRGTVSFENFPADWAEPTYQLVRFIVVALDLVIAFPYLPGSASPAFQGVTIFIGALFSLGSTSVVANIVAGVVLTYTRAFKVGDRVKIAETIGDVLEKSLLVTRVRTIKNVEITIPNSLVLGSHIVNYSSVSQKERGLILNTSVTLGYDLPWREVHKALIKAALITTDVLPEPSPFVLQTSLDDFYVNYEINAYTSKPHNMAVIYSELHQNIQDACNEAGLEILSPHYNSVRDGNTTSIPKEYLPKDYRPPLFNINMRNEDKT
jgi:small-conductance mechanosensitive channel